jgi:anti-anti-sigma factor
MDDDHVAVHVAGEVDASNADAFAQLLEVASQQRSVVGLYLGDATYLDSAALRVIVRATCAIRDGGGDLRVRESSEVARQILQTAGLFDELCGSES